MKILKEQLEEVIKKNLPEKGIKWMQEGNNPKDKKGYTDGFNQALSQINPSLIADEVLKVVDGGISELTYYYKNKAVDEIEEDVAYIKVEEIINLLDNLSPNKENE